MLLIVGSGGATTLETRPVVPVPNVAAGSLAGDLERTHEVESERRLPTSPLMALLGCVGGDPGRLLALGTWEVGLDWIGGRLPDGTRLSGQKLVAAVETALQSLDLLRLDRAADVFLAGVGAEAGVSEGEDLLAWVQFTLRPVSVTAVADYETDALLDAYEVAELLPLATVELLVRSRRGDVLSRCQHCWSLFMPEERANEIYCRRAAPGEPPGGRTCRQLGAQARYHARLDELHAAYRRRYKRFDQRARRDGRPRADVDRWRHQARQLLEEAEAQSWSRERFERELDLTEGAE